MRTREKISIVALVILIIILAINFWSVQKSNPPKKINCQTACHKMGSGRWLLPSAKYNEPKTFATQEQCIFVCQARIKK